MKSSTPNWHQNEFNTIKIEETPKFNLIMYTFINIKFRY